MRVCWWEDDGDVFFLALFNSFSFSFLYLRIEEEGRPMPPQVMLFVIASVVALVSRYARRLPVVWSM